MQPDNLPKVILIGGAPFSGKTSLARNLASAMECCSVSTDDLGLAVRTVNSGDPVLNPMGEMDHLDYYRKYSLDGLVAHTVRQHEKMKTAILSVIRSHAEWAPRAVVEGWCLYPDWVTADFSCGVRSLWLNCPGDVLLDRISRDESFRGDNEVIEKYWKRSLWHQNVIIDQATKHGMQVLEVRRDTDPDRLAKEVRASLPRGR